MQSKKRKIFLFSCVLSALTMFFAYTGITHCYAAAERTLDVSTPSENEIRSRADTIDLARQITYAQEPVTTGSYDPGALSDDTLKDAVNVLNQMRYIAGISDHVTLNSDYNAYAQAGALINYVNGQMSHTPKRPADMNEDLYQKGYKGTSEGNLHTSTAPSMSMNSAIVTGWLADDGDNNLATVGHRRWCLNPAMEQTGFGAVTGEKGSHSCMYAFDGAQNTSSYETVVWPAQMMPTEYFGGSYPWSISSVSDFSADTKITLTRNRAGNETVWNFSSASSDGHFQISNAGYGMHGCVIFRPSQVGSYQDGDVFTVEVSENGSTTLSYTVTFFSLSKTPENAKIGLLYDVRGVKVNEQTANFIDLTDESITQDKITITIKDDSIAQTQFTSNGFLIKGLKEGQTTITVSLPNGSSAACDVTVVPQTHEHDYSLTRTTRKPTCYMEGIEVRNLCACGDTASFEYYTLDKTDHDYQVKSGTPATCTEEGSTDGIVCIVCGDAKQQPKILPALGHDLTITKGKEATCTEEGLTDGESCSRCDYRLEQKTIPALGHDTVIDAAVEPTYTSPGLTEGKHCKRCGTVIVTQLAIPQLTKPDPDTSTPGNSQTQPDPGTSTPGNSQTQPGPGTSAPGSSQTQPNPGTLTVGTTLTDKKSGGIYVIRTTGASGQATVEYKAPIKKNAVSVNVPDVVVIDHVTYKVTSIASNAFKNCKKLKRVTIGKNISRIGAKAFYGCKKLSKITIKTTALTTRNVGGSAFKKINAKATVKVPKKVLRSYKKLLKKKGISPKAKIKK